MKNSNRFKYENSKNFTDHFNFPYLQRSPSIAGGVASVLVVAASVWLTASLAQAQGSGVRGGGQAALEQRTGGFTHLRLRDLVDPSVCTWMPLSVALEKLPASAAFFTKLAQVHGYLADALEREGERLSLCFTSDIQKVPTQDQDAVSAHTIGAKTAALRWDHQVFVDRLVFQKLPSEDQVLLLVHEILHSWIPMDTTRRNEKIRSTTRGLREAAHGELTPSRLALYLQENTVQIGSYGAGLEDLRSPIQQLLSPASADSAKLQALYLIGLETVETLLVAGDRLAARQFVDRITKELRLAVENGDRSALESWLRRGFRPSFPLFATAKVTDASQEWLSLLDLVTQQGDVPLLEFLLKQEPEAPRPNPAKKMVARFLRGEVELTDPHHWIELGVSGSDAVWLSKGNRNALFLSLVIEQDRLDWVSAFAEQPELSQATFDTAFADGIQAGKLSGLQMLVTLGKVQWQASVASWIELAITARQAGVLAWLLSLGMEQPQVDGKLDTALSSPALLDALLKPMGAQPQPSEVEVVTVLVNHPHVRQSWRGQSVEYSAWRRIWDHAVYLGRGDIVGILLKDPSIQAVLTASLAASTAPVSAGDSPSFLTVGPGAQKVMQDAITDQNIELVRLLRRSYRWDTFALLEARLWAKQRGQKAIEEALK